MIDRPEDVREVQDWLSRFPEALAENVYLMPQATTAESLREKAPWVQAAAQAQGWQFSPRLHVELYGARRGV